MDAAGKINNNPGLTHMSQFCFSVFRLKECSFCLSLSWLWHRQKNHADLDRCRCCCPAQRLKFIAPVGILNPWPLPHLLPSWINWKQHGVNDTNHYWGLPRPPGVRVGKGPVSGWFSELEWCFVCTALVLLLISIFVGRCVWMMHHAEAFGMMHLSTRCEWKWSCFSTANALPIKCWGDLAFLHIH